MKKAIESGEVAVVAGFQGVAPGTRISTLGRGGSDTSAVAVAAGIGAARCDIYTDVDGVYTTDPRIVPKARRLEKIAYEEMLEMASLGAKVLQTRSVEIAMLHQVPTRVLSTFTPDVGGTLLCDEEDIVEKKPVTGIAYSRDEAKITLHKVPDKLEAALAAGEIPVVAGFQGVDRQGRLATLGRGAGDLSAVAVAAALRADRCDIYTDVDGVYTTDPRIESRARKLEKISYEEMLEMASLGAKVLQTRSVELAMAQNVPVRVLSSFVEPGEAPGQGTIVCDEDEIMEKRIVSGVAYSRDEAKISLFGLPDHPGVSSAIFGALADANVNVDMIVQSHSRRADTANMEFTVGKRDAARAVEIVRAAQAEIGFDDVAVNEDVSKVSVIGVGMRSHTGVAKTMFGALAEKGVNIQVISTSEIKISVLIEAAYTELAVRALHAAYGLDQL